MNGKLKTILSTGQAGGTLTDQPSAQLQADKGLVGDRYYLTQGTFSERLKNSPDWQLTLIEQEEIDSFNQISQLNYNGPDFRRNLVTQGVRLNDLVDREFYVGSVKLRGIRLCEPCAHLSEQLGPEIMQHMIHKCGLRAQILSNGEIQIGDNIAVTT